MNREAISLQCKPPTHPCLPSILPSHPQPPLPLRADLSTGARTAEPAIQEAYLRALHGALLSSGDRLSPETISKVGAALKAVTSAAGEDEDLRSAAAGAAGAFAKHCSPAELVAVLEAGPLGVGSGKLAERIGSAQTAAAVARHAAARLEEQGLLPRFVGESRVNQMLSRWCEE